MNAALDVDAITACADLARRSGAREVEFGYLHDDVPSEKAGWYAHCLYRGAKLIADDRKSPEEAADALARRILAGAQCNHCKLDIVLNDDAIGCRWMRLGSRWKRGCE